MPRCRVMLGRMCRAVVIRRCMQTARRAADERLRQSERTFEFDEGVIKKFEICQLAANQPIEDFYSLGRCVSTQAMLLAVCDGHGGTACSRYISAQLLAYVCAAALEKHIVRDVPVDQRLEWIFSSSDVHLPGHFEVAPKLSEFYEAFRRRKEGGTVREALQTAFDALDEEISSSALPDSNGRINRLRASIAAAGSCASLAHIRNTDVHVANVGDCAAVLGIATPGGGVSALPLSRAHCVDNMDEVQRVKAAHPSSETGILRGGRLLGELYPLRAFGDVRYKWPLDLQKAVLGAMGAPPPPNLLSPPYLSATPEVFYHKLTQNDCFLILASDGLWEWFDADTAVRLVRDHSLGALSLQPFEPTVGHTLQEVHHTLRARRAGERKKPLDSNSATHLVRYALGGITGGVQEQYHRLHDQLLVPAGTARSYRDDISVIVVHFDPEAIAASMETDDGR